MYIYNIRHHRYHLCNFFIFIFFFFLFIRYSFHNFVIVVVVSLNIFRFEFFVFSCAYIFTILNELLICTHTHTNTTSSLVFLYIITGELLNVYYVLICIIEALDPGIRAVVVFQFFSLFCSVCSLPIFFKSIFFFVRTNLLDF